MGGWGELDLEAKANVVWAAAGIVLAGVFCYAAVRMIRTHEKLEKRLHLDGDGDD